MEERLMNSTGRRPILSDAHPNNGEEPMPKKRKQSYVVANLEV